MDYDNIKVADFIFLWYRFKLSLCTITFLTFLGILIGFDYCL